MSMVFRRGILGRDAETPARLVLRDLVSQQLLGHEHQPELSSQHEEDVGDGRPIVEEAVDKLQGGAGAREQGRVDGGEDARLPGLADQLAHVPLLDGAVLAVEAELFDLIAESPQVSADQLGEEEGRSGRQRCVKGRATLEDPSLELDAPEDGELPDLRDRREVAQQRVVAP